MQRRRFCFLPQNSLCEGASVVVKQHTAELLKAGYESFDGRITGIASSPSVG